MKERSTEQVPSNYSVTYMSILKTEGETMEGKKIEHMSDYSCNATNKKSNKTFNNHHSHDEEVENVTASINFLFSFVIVGVCVFICFRLF